MSNPQTTLKNGEAEFIEGYARALWDMALVFDGVDGYCKSYDPMTIAEGSMHSYVFNLKDGGRHHPIKDYKGKDEICNLLLEEAITWVPIQRK